MTEISLSAQVISFFVMVLCGLFCGFLFDIFRALRRFHKSTNGVVALQDVVFWLLELFLVYLVAFRLDYAHIRAYEGIALVIGSWLYFMVLSFRVMGLLKIAIAFFAKTLSFVCTPLVKLLRKSAKAVQYAKTKVKSSSEAFLKKTIERAKKSKKSSLQS